MNTINTKPSKFVYINGLYGMVTDKDLSCQLIKDYLDTVHPGLDTELELDDASGITYLYSNALKADIISSEFCEKVNENIDQQVKPCKEGYCVVYRCDKF